MLTAGLKVQAGYVVEFFFNFEAEDLDMFTFLRNKRTITTLHFKTVDKAISLF